MDIHRWEKLGNLFFAALECEAERRAAFLDDACGDNSELRQELEAMLAADEDSNVLALESRLLSADSSKDSPSESFIGTCIGPYLIERLIGEGGMGEVYLAQRNDDQYRQKVALKLVRPGFRNVELLARFRMERQVLARLTHPNITQLLDGGIDPEGRPYLVMQYIEGIPITHFCDRHGLTIEERLKLFSKVCEAVHYAHRNLVVHRDLKPSNILVTEDGAVKLLDFGIAKLLDSDWGDVSMAVTQSQIRLMTPEYAAPEQVRGDTITTATDVYALGVLLYELLSGRRPYRIEKRMQAEIERIICEEEPLRPSTAVSEGGTASSDAFQLLSPRAVSEARRTGVKRLQKMLKGDLDNLVMMALRKEPERRYASVEQMALDIQHYLYQKPLLARPSTLGYRVRKYVNRHRTGVISALAIVLLLVTGLGLALVQTRQIQIERDRAQQALEQSEEVTSFLMGLFAANSPEEARGDTLSARDLLERGVERAYELKSQPEVFARMLGVIGQSYLSLGKYDQAQPFLEQARDEWQRLGKIPEAAQAMLHLANVWVAKGDLEKSDSLLVRAAFMVENTNEVSETDLAEVIHARASYFMERAEFDRADSLYRQALAIRERALGPDHLATLRSLRGLASALEKKDRYEESEMLFRRALTSYQAKYGEVHIEIARLKDYLSTLLYKKDDFDEAIRLSEESIELSRIIYPADHPQLGVRLVNHAKILLSRARTAEAEPYLIEGAALFKETFGPHHPDYAWARQNLASIMMSRRDFDRAAEVYEEVIEIHRATLGNHHPRLGTSLLSYSALQAETGAYSIAESLSLEALGIYREAYGETHISVGTAYTYLASQTLAQNRYDAALAYCENALSVYRVLYPDGHVRVATALNLKGRVFLATGRSHDAEPLFREAIAIRAEAFGAEHWLVGQIRSNLGESLWQQGRTGEAGSEFRQAFDGFERADRWMDDARKVLIRLENYYKRTGQSDSVRYFERIRMLHFSEEAP